MSNNVESEFNPEAIPLSLKGSLKSFMGTELAPVIEKSLKAAGINPNTYDPTMSAHENYHGYPVSEASREDGVLSPIILEIGELMEQGKIIIDSKASSSVHLKPWTAPETYDPQVYETSAYQLSKLEGMPIEGLVDAETNQVIAYAVELSGDGGLPGHVLISTNDVEQYSVEQ